MLKKIKEGAGTTVFILILLLITYIVINITHLLWNITNPEGFWSYGVFIDFLRGAVIALVVMVVVFGLLVAILINIITGIRNGFNKKELQQLFIYLLVFPLISVINYFWEIGPILYLDTKMSNKYSYINQSEEYFSEGNYQAAVQNGKNAYLKERRKINASNFFILTKLYQNTDWFNKQNLINKYAATINYGYCLRKSPSQLKEAEAVLTEALQIANSNLLQPDNNLIIFPSLSLAELFLDQGRYIEAEGHFNKLLAVANAIQSEDILYVYMTHEVFARHLERIGDKRKAAQLRIKAFNLYDSSDLSHKNSFYLALLLNAASSEIVLEHMDNAGDFIIKAQPLADKRKDKEIYLDFLTLKGTYCNLAAIKNDGRSDVINKSTWEKATSLFSSEIGLKDQFILEATECFYELVKENKSRHGKDDTSVGQSLTFLGSFNATHGKYNEAKTSFDEALKIFEANKQDNLGFYHSLLLSSLTTNFYLNQNQDLEKKILQVENYHFNKLVANYLFLTEEEKESYVFSVEKDINTLNSLYVNLKTPKFNQKLYNNILAIKNIALYSNQYTRNIISTIDKSIELEYLALIKEKEQFQTFKKSPNFTRNVQLENVIKLKEQAILKKLGIIPKYKPFKPQSLTWVDVRNSLKDNEVAIEIINVSSSPHLKDSLEYFALILDKQTAFPKLISLFRESHLKKILNQKGDTKERIDNIYLKNKALIYKTIWAPLEKHLANKSQAYVSVSGILHTISFPALLIDSPTPITFLSSTRQIAMEQDMPGQLNSAALFGDINYDYNFKKSYIPRLDNKNEDIQISSLQRSLVKRLPFTAAEVVNIKNIFGSKAKIYTDTSATEVSFRQLGNKSKVIHVATHGFYNRNSFSSLNNNILANMGGSSNYFDNPLSKCGILFAGANNSNILNKENDGVLTALEISKFNFSNVDLVVLSACETGLGDIQGSEGVYGLQRAFKLAGAASTLVSLWKVDDKSTSELMKYFYDFYNRGFSKTVSLKLAQLELRKTQKSPFDWAGFILIN
jgi:CHAT domain-containing protein